MSPARFCKLRPQPLFFPHVQIGYVVRVQALLPVVTFHYKVMPSAPLTTPELWIKHCPARELNSHWNTCSMTPGPLENEMPGDPSMS